ncbi:hypothetical protein Moror_16465 [Moniliophthora roreri MCA 2997]|uniref:Uncharacterized protein n=1 Tax=Moniliophthora roreri (strain MCA 2997) TaxID=1381753 RepID=V2YGQ0_MONRO|nr:hypothetical protein Moror_16465 [Moniliophthora roreri MCA 2997]
MNTSKPKTMNPRRVPQKLPTPSPPRSPLSSPPLSPSEAIAGAWHRESAESKEKWRRIDANVRRRYEEPRFSRERRTKL